MFRLVVNQKTFDAIFVENVPYVDFSYNENMTRQFFDEFSQKWGRVGYDRANQDLANGFMIGLKTGFDALFGCHSEKENRVKKIYWFREFVRLDDAGYEMSHWVRLFFLTDANMVYTREFDNREIWGNGAGLIRKNTEQED